MTPNPTSLAGEFFNWVDIPEFDSPDDVQAFDASICRSGVKVFIRKVCKAEIPDQLREEMKSANGVIILEVTPGIRTIELTDGRQPPVTLKCKPAPQRLPPVRCSDMVRRMGRQSHKAIERILKIGSMTEAEAYEFLRSEKSATVLEVEGAAHGSVRVSDPLKPSVGVLIKLGSAVVHIEEMKSYRFAPSEHAYAFDLAALSQTLDDPEVKEWLAQMSKLGFMPVKR
jgi:hypothetical protein